MVTARLWYSKPCTRDRLEGTVGNIDDRQIDVTRSKQISDYDRTRQLEEPHTMNLVFVRWSRTLKHRSKPSMEACLKIRAGKELLFANCDRFCRTGAETEGLSLLDLR